MVFVLLIEGDKRFSHTFADGLTYLFRGLIGRTSDASYKSVAGPFKLRMAVN